MKRCIATVLLMLSLEALLAGRLSAAVADDDVDTIRLPSHGLAREVINGSDVERPWKCCDRQLCTRSLPPFCFCGDRVKHCASTCKRCEVDEEDSSLHVCRDRYHGFPGPRCTKDANGDDNNVPSGVADDHQVTMAATTEAGKKKERPWKCCDDGICGMSFPPICFCRDKVERCAAACEHCEKDEEDSSRYICKDSYRGDTGPRCTKDGNGEGSNNDVPSGVADDRRVMVAVADVGKTKGGNMVRPWKCCDEAWCSGSTKLIPPVCLCVDKVEQCDPACTRCTPDTRDPSLFRCRTYYRGDPGPKCTVIGAGGN